MSYNTICCRSRKGKAWSQSTVIVPSMMYRTPFEPYNTPGRESQKKIRKVIAYLFHVRDACTILKRHSGPLRRLSVPAFQSLEGDDLLFEERAVCMGL